MKCDICDIVNKILAFSCFSILTEVFQMNELNQDELSKRKNLSSLRSDQNNPTKRHSIVMNLPWLT